jgi:negative regulator of flagellin synthesis FlgM
MAEKISGQGISRVVDTTAVRRPDKAGQSSGPQPTRAADPLGGEQVDVANAQLLLRLEEALQSAPAVDVDRVQAVRDALASGRYEIDPYAIADKMLELDREFGA